MISLAASRALEVLDALAANDLVFWGTPVAIMVAALLIDMRASNKIILRRGRR